MNDLRTHGVLAALGVLMLATSCTSPPREGVDEKFNFLPLARYETSANPPGYTVDALWPMIQSHRAGEAHGSRVFPLWIHEDDGAGEDFLNVAILYWQTLDDQTGSIERTLFPILFMASGADREKFHVWPLYGLDEYGGPEDPARTDTVLGPLFEWDRSVDGNRGRVSVGALWPLFALWRQGHDDWQDEAGVDHTNRDLRVGAFLGDLFGLLQHDRQNVADGDATTATTETNVLHLMDVLELFERIDDEDGTRTRVLGLFDEPWAALYTHLTETDENGALLEEWNHLFPIWFHGENGSENMAMLFPLFGRKTTTAGLEKTWLIPPFFSYETDSSRDLEALDALWPLWRFERRGGADPGTHVRMLPLLWFTRRPDSDVEVLLPFWVSITDEHSEYTHLLPLWGRHVERDGELEKTFWLPPLWIHTTDRGRRLDRHDVLWPLMRFETAADGVRNRVFPLFWYESAGARSHLNVMLAFDRQTSEVRSSTLLWPLYGSVDALGSGTRTSILPLADGRFVTDDDPVGEQTSVLWPLTSFERDGLESRRWIFPFYWWFDDGVKESHKHLWPLVGRDEDGGMVTWSTLWPFFFAGSNGDGSRSESGFLFPFGGSKREDETARRWFFPLFYDRVTEPDAPDAEGSRNSWVLWPLFSRQASADGSSRWHSLFHFLRAEENPAAGTSEFSVLGGMYRTRVEPDRTTRSMAFLFGYENDGQESTLRLFHLIPIRW